MFMKSYITVKAINVLMKENKEFNQRQLFGAKVILEDFIVIAKNEVFMKGIKKK